MTTCTSGLGHDFVNLRTCRFCGVSVPPEVKAEWDRIDAKRAAGVHLGDEGLRAADVLQKVQAICDEWGGHDSWGVHDIYVDTLMERLSAALATSAEGEDR